MVKKYQAKTTSIFWLTIPFLIFASYLINYYDILSARGSEIANEDLLEEKVLQRVDISDFTWNEEGVITFWFDDAWLSQFEIGYPAMESRGWKAAMAVPTYHIGWEAYMNWNQVLKLFHLGWEITAHSRSHNCDLTDLPRDAVVYEVIGSQYDLAQRGILADIYVPPCGVISDEIDQVVKSNFKAQRGVIPGVNPLPVPLNNRYDLLIKTIDSETQLEEVQSLIRETKRTKGWLIIMLHEIGEDGSVYSTSTELFLEIVKEVAESDLTVVLPSEALSIQ
jgi:peptidoglycan/xylan/chitin deacetylase (PgdA/CDA1 family)